MPPVPSPTGPSEPSPTSGEDGSPSPEQAGMAPQEAVRAWRVGDQVSLQRTPRYLKTADPMPMLRPPDLVGIDEVGTVVGLRALGQLAVRFRRGTFLVEAEAVSAASGSEGSDSEGKDGAQG
ncbi:NAD(P)H dehydrogenase assembly family protein [Cyanobium sp. PCC 7001]|uniref:NAD(P)H dehydrogenase assembly family protein n=1 Tax=Cyanobium sp. PCC 7001 TaxID=180281 RepID=UPI00350E3548